MSYISPAYTAAYKFYYLKTFRKFKKGYFTEKLAFHLENEGGRGGEIQFG